MNQAPGAARPAAAIDSGSWTIQTLIQALAARGEGPALRWLRRGSSGALSGAELADRSKRLAAALIQDGVAVGEPVALVGRNGPEWVVARLALGAAGALVVALDDLSGAAELAASLSAAGCTRVLTTARHVPALRQLAGGGLDLIVIDDDAPAVEGARTLREIGAGAAAALPPLGPDAAAMLVQTSGTTGPPKSFVLTYAHLWTNIDALAKERLIGPDDMVLLPLPLHHVYPLVVGLLTSLQSGAVVLVAEAVAGPEIVEAFRIPGVTVVVGVPRLYAAILAGIDARVAGAGRIAAAAFHGLLGLAIAARRRLGLDIGRKLFRGLRARFAPSLRLLVSGGARIEPEVLWPLVGLGFEVRSGYGLAETASIFTGNLPGRERLGSEGRAFQGGEIRIAEPDQDGIGEILLRGPNVFTEYRGRPEATREAFTPDGWFRTGDLGYLDADGYLYVTGRTKEMLVLGGGKKVHPEELEKVYGDDPAIREIAVLERAGAVVALVMPEAKRIQESGQRIDDVIRVTLATKSQALPSFKRISGFALVRESLPRTRLGKYRRFLLPEIYERARQGIAAPTPAEPSPEDRELLGRPLSRQIVQLLQERYREQSIALDANLQLDLGVDSLEWLGLLLALDQRLGLRLAEGDAARVATVRDLITLAEAQAGAAAPEAGRPTAAPADMGWIAPLGAALTVFGALLAQSPAHARAVPAARRGARASAAGRRVDHRRQPRQRPRSPGDGRLAQLRADAADLLGRGREPPVHAALAAAVLARGSRHARRRATAGVVAGPGRGRAGARRPPHLVSRDVAVARRHAAALPAGGRQADRRFRSPRGAGLHRRHLRGDAARAKAAPSPSRARPDRQSARCRRPGPGRRRDAASCPHRQGAAGGGRRPQRAPTDAGGRGGRRLTYIKDAASGVA